MNLGTIKRQYDVIFKVMSAFCLIDKALVSHVAILQTLNFLNEKRVIFVNDLSYGSKKFGEAFNKEMVKDIEGWKIMLVTAWANGETNRDQIMYGQTLKVKERALRKLENKQVKLEGELKERKRFDKVAKLYKECDNPDDPAQVLEIIKQLVND